MCADRLQANVSFRLSVRRSLLLLLSLALASVSKAQTAPFAAVGAGVTFPAGRASEPMHNGWMTEVMGGVTVLDGIIGLRVGAWYGESSAGAMSGGMGDMSGMGAPMTGGRVKMLGAMLGTMLMPIEIRRVTPYVLADAGTVRSSFSGHMNSFTWQLGGGVMIDLTGTRLYVEARYMEARRGADSGAMVPITLGLRFPR